MVFSHLCCVQFLNVDTANGVHLKCTSEPFFDEMLRRGKMGVRTVGPSWMQIWCVVRLCEQPGDASTWLSIQPRVLTCVSSSCRMGTACGRCGMTARCQSWQLG